MKKMIEQRNSSVVFHAISHIKMWLGSTESRVLLYTAGATTILAGILHLLMIGPSLKPYNFPMELLPYTDTLFFVAGMAQIIWAIPMVKNWSINWYYVGMIGTFALTVLLILTRIPNEITGTALQDKNPMALLTELTQSIYIGVTAIIIAGKKIGLYNHV